MSGFDSGSAGPALAPASPAMVVRRRPASVNLRSGEGEAGGNLMDPANRSLADALRITYRLLQVAMLGLVAMFLFSGLQSVKEGERGIRVMFGRDVADDLPPGFQFSLPRPIGEIVKVETGQQAMRLEREFWPDVRGEDAAKSLQELAGLGRMELDPAKDGSLLTGDLNIAHARWTLTYQRKDVRLNARNILPEAERAIVRAAAMRGIVRATAQLSIDEFLKNQPDASRAGPFPDPQETALAVARRTLEEMQSGIEITSLVMELRTPPLALIGDFDRVQSSQSAAQKSISEAQTARVERLSEAAGPEAAQAMLDLIDAYETALARSDAAAAARAERSISNLLEGRDSPEDDVPEGVRVAGRAATQISRAVQERSTAVSRATAQARTFTALLAAYRQSPDVVRTVEWDQAMSKFLSGETVEKIWLPVGADTVQIMINRNPDLARAAERRRIERGEADGANAAAREAERSILEKHKENAVNASP